jgi:tetratricopeptide (TPR) repeat protein
LVSENGSKAWVEAFWLGSAFEKNRRPWWTAGVPAEIIREDRRVRDSRTMPVRMYRMIFRRLAALPVIGALAVAGPAWAKCQLRPIANLPVTMLGMRALLPAKINGEDVQFLVDSGASFSFITPANADKFNLPRESLPYGLFITGVTDSVNAEVGIVKVLTLANASLHNIQFVVGGSEVGQGAVGLLGQNVLSLGDVEYDLAKGAIHLWMPSDCSYKMDMAYWAGATADSVIDLETDDRRRYVAHTIGSVYVNGVKLTAMFDTGAMGSIMTKGAAARAGITPDGPGAVSAGYSSGLGKRVARSWIAPVKSFKIGSEEIRNFKMRFGDIGLDDADLLVGADFFLAHHIYVSNQQHKLYLTYNGGPVFDLNETPRQIAEMTPPAAGAPPSNSAPDLSNADPTDAAGFARRGAGYAARNDLVHAIADLGRAIELAPTVPDYYYQRGLVYLRNRQPFLAMADFNQTLRLKPDDVAALAARAKLRLVGHDTAQAVKDLEAADKASAKQDDVHLQIAALYANADLLPAAIDQYNLWIDAHSEDSRLPQALNGRCWARALTGVDLDKALNDCNRAIRNAPKNAAMFDSRGLVRLRLGDLDKAIADYDAALAINPRLGWSLYGRGLAKQRKGLTADGGADIAAATAINPKLPELVKMRGLTP